MRIFIAKYFVYIYKVYIFAPCLSETAPKIRIILISVYIWKRKSDRRLN